MNGYITKILVVLFAFLISFSFVACSDKDNVGVSSYEEKEVNNSGDEDNAKVPEVKQMQVLEDRDFSVDVGTNVVLGGKHDEITTEDNAVSTRFSDERTVNDIYVYDNFKITVDPVKDSIVGIDLTTPKYSTNRGIKVGDYLSDVSEKYGDYNNSSINSLRESYMYFYNDMVLIFLTDSDGRIVSIKYEYI